jgi:hypothetical protein
MRIVNGIMETQSGSGLFTNSGIGRMERSKRVRLVGAMLARQKEHV